MAQADLTNDVMDVSEGAADMSPDERAKTAVDSNKTIKKQAEPKLKGAGKIETPDKDRVKKGLEDIDKAKAAVKKQAEPKVPGLKEAQDEDDDEDTDLEADEKKEQKKMVKKTKHEMTAGLLKKYSSMSHEALSSVYSSTFSEDLDDNEDVQLIDNTEALNVVFEGEDFSDDTKERFATIFESAVSTKVLAEKIKIEEAVETRLQENVDATVAALTEQVDKYLEHAVDVWLKENQVAIDHGIKVDVAEEFISGLKGLFESHNVFVDVDTDAQLDERAKEISELKAKIKEGVDREIALKEDIKSFERAQVFNEVSAELAQTDVERLEGLAEDIEFADADTYKRKLGYIVEKYFGVKSVSGASDINEGVSDERIVDDTPSADRMAADAISASVKKY